MLHSMTISVRNKPKNIMLDPAAGTVKLADFDIGRRLTDTFSRNTGKEPSGSLPYMGPQQLLGQNSLEQDDIYSLGATLYELLTGTPPFYMGDLREQIKCVVPGSMAQRRRDLLAEHSIPGLGEPIPQEWENVVAACLAKERAQRPTSGAEVMARVAQPASAPRPAAVPIPQPIPQPQPAPAPPSQPVPRVTLPASFVRIREKMMGEPRMLVAGGVLGVLLCGLTAWAIVRSRSHHEPAVTEVRKEHAQTPADGNPVTATVPTVDQDKDKDHDKKPPVVHTEPEKVPPVVSDDHPPERPPAKQGLAELGVKEWQPLAEGGDAFAQALMARACLGGVHGARLDLNQARIWAKKSAAQLHPLGLHLAGTLSETDPEIPAANRRRIATDYYARSVAAGFFVKAEGGGKQWIERSGRAYLLGNGVPKDERKGVGMLRVAAGMNDPAAISNLGVCYMGGTGVAKDQKKAVDCYLKAAGMNVPSAMNNLGDCYENGVGVDKDASEAAKWYRKAADLNEPHAMLCLGWCYERGFGVKLDRKAAADWYRKAAELNDPLAMTWFANCCNNGFGVAKDYKLAADWYRKAAEMNQAVAMRNLGWCYDKGVGVRVDKKLAVDWYRKAVECNNDAQAMSLLGACYETGQGVAKDQKEAAAWYVKAVELNNPIAMRALGLCYLRGAGVSKDPVEAARLFRRGTELNDPVCMTNLGYCFETGAGVTRDFNEALRWYRKAADLQEPMAMNNIGAWYEHGTGMSLGDDVKKAVEWYRKAAALGNENAKTALKRLGK